MEVKCGKAIDPLLTGPVHVQCACSHTLSSPTPRAQTTTCSSFTPLVPIIDNFSFSFFYLATFLTIESFIHRSRKCRTTMYHKQFDSKYNNNEKSKCNVNGIKNVNNIMSTELYYNTLVYVKSVKSFDRLMLTVEQHAAKMF